MRSRLNLRQLIRRVYQGTKAGRRPGQPWVNFRPRLEGFEDRLVFR